MSKKKADNNIENYLDFVPIKNDLFSYTESEEGLITILIENVGVFNRIAQKCFKRPRFTQVHLDEMGNFIWPLIDGERTIYDISVLVKERFGAKSEPLYDRLVSYFHILQNYEFIIYKNK